MNKKNIVIVGAGFSGIYTAKHLAKKLKHQKQYQIVLVDKNSYMTYQTELHEVATERVEAEHVREDLEMLFHKSRNVKIVTAEVTKIDTKKKVLKTSTHGLEIPYHKLVMATGGESNDFGTPGVKEHGFELWSLEDALAIREHLRQTITAGARELDDKKRAADLTVAVVGSGFTGAEFMGEMIEQRQVLAKELKLEPTEIKLVLLEAAPSILNMLKDRRLAQKAMDYFTENNIEIRLSAQVTGVDADGVTFKKGPKLMTHSLIWTAGVKAKSMLDRLGLKYEAGRGGRIIVQYNMKIDGYKDIYAIGDTVEWVDPKSGPTPQTVEGGESMAATAVKDILLELKDKKPTYAFKRMDHGYAVSLGAHYTVASLFGWINISGFFATLAKHGINLYYFSQIHSLGSIWKYFTNEFFRMRNQREPFRGMISRQGNTLWSLPLRLFMGFIWINAALTDGHQLTHGLLNGMNTTGNVITLLIGLAFVIGAFVWPMALVSIIMAIVAWHLNGFDISAWWLIFGAIALMNGAGRNFGFDHVLQPLFQKGFGTMWYGKRQSRYNQLDQK